MTLRIDGAKVIALFKKDFKDTLKNGHCLLMALLPILLTALYRFLNFGGISLERQFVLTLGLLMNMSLMPISVMSLMIAEEKEKNTLRTLMLSNVSAADFLASKSLMIFLLAQAVNLVIYAVTGTGSIGIARFLLVTSLAILCMMLFGAVVGLLCRNQMSTGMLSAPFALLFMLPAIFAQIDEGIARFARFTPTYAMMQLLNGNDVSLLPLGVLFAWIIIGAALFGVIYQNKRLD